MKKSKKLTDDQISVVRDILLGRASAINTMLDWRLSKLQVSACVYTAVSENAVDPVKWAGSTDPDFIHDFKGLMQDLNTTTFKFNGLDRSAMKVYSDNLRAAYIKDPLKCPFCGSESIKFETDTLDISGESAYQSIHCTACGGSWDDTYRFMDVVIWIPEECQKCIKLGTPECRNDRKVFSCREEK